LDYKRVTSLYAEPADHRRLLGQLEAKGALDGVEITFKRLDGSELPVTLTTRRIIYDGRDALISAITDLTQRKAAESEVARQRDVLHQADKMSALGSLLAGVAHELNNPLAVLVGQAVMMEQDLASNPALSQRAGKIQKAAERCSRIVKAFLAMARRRPAEQGEVELKQIIDTVLELTGYSIRANDIQVRCELETDLPPLWADQDQLGQLILNLVLNAQQALIEVPGARRLRIGAQLIADAKQVLVEVEDNGPGIPKDMRSRVFEPFFTTKPIGVGTGVGLSLCRSIVSSHGGTITADDAPSGGALFRVTLPLGQGDSPKVTAQSPSHTVTGRRQRILIVDDEPDIAEMLAEILDTASYRSVIARSGQDALNKIAQQAFDVILCDIRMPDLDGPGLYKALAESYPQLTRRVIFMTGDILSGPSSVELNNTVPVIEKPFKPAEIKRVVAERLAGLGG
jgi:signal transduction histidine kinase